MINITDGDRMSAGYHYRQYFLVFRHTGLNMVIYIPKQ